MLALAPALGCRTRLDQGETLGWFAAIMMAWGVLVAQAHVNLNLLHLATSEAQLVQANAHRDTATALLTLVKSVFPIGAPLRRRFDSVRSLMCDEPNTI